MMIFRWATVIILVLFLGLPQAPALAASPQQAPVPAADVSLDNFSVSTILIGQQVNFTLTIDVTAVPGVTSADIYVNYNPAQIAPAGSPGSPAVSTDPDFFGFPNSMTTSIMAAGCPVDTANPITNTSCIHLVLSGPAQTTQRGVAARFHFVGVGVGSGTSCVTITDATLTDITGATLTPPVTTCLAISHLDTSGVVLRQGVAAAGNHSCSQVAYAPTYLGGPLPMFTDSTGAFNFPDMVPGTYTFRATYPGYLYAEKSFSVVTSLPPATLGTVTLRGGDVNGDTRINILDIGLIIGIFGDPGVSGTALVPPALPNAANCPPTTPDTAADINGDLIVNVSDLAIAAGNWGLTTASLENAWP
jgi:hypothetical protein